jgi:hypothetical protein
MDRFNEWMKAKRYDKDFIIPAGEGDDGYGNEVGIKPTEKMLTGYFIQYLAEQRVQQQGFSVEINAFNKKLKKMIEAVPPKVIQPFS